MRSEWPVTVLCCGDSGTGVKNPRLKNPLPNKEPRFGGAFFKSRGFGGEIGLVTANMKWCGAFLFGAIVLPIVILNFVVAFVLPKFPNDLDLTSQFRFVCGRVGDTFCALDAFPRGCISGHVSLRSYFVVVFFVFQPFFRALDTHSVSHSPY